jgi:hypothetical protein
MYMHTYNYISDIYAKNTFGMAEFLPIHVQNCMLKKEKKKTNSRLVVPNDTMLVLNDTELCQTALCFFQHSADRHCDF